MLTQDVEKLKQEFGDREFTGKDMERVLGLKTFHGTGWRIKWLAARNMIHATAHGYRFGALPIVSDDPVAIADAVPVAVPVQVAPDHSAYVPPSLMRIGEFYMHERMLLIAHTGNQEGSPAIRIYTTIIEVDPATKHPRNKVVNFAKARDPREYAQAMAWLDTMAGNPPSVVDDTALELAAELETKLNAAQKEIAELKSKLDAIRGAL